MHTVYRILIHPVNRFWLKGFELKGASAGFFSFDHLNRMSGSAEPEWTLLRDRWDNIESLKDYAGPVDIFGAARDEIIPVAHAKALAKQVPKARFTQITAGHNDWSASTQVEITR